MNIVGPYSIVLEEASWVANSGRMNEFVRTGNGGQYMEIEPVGVVGVRWESWIEWPHKLFKEAV